jgi:hypothetical protein
MLISFSSQTQLFFLILFLLIHGFYDFVPVGSNNLSSCKNFKLPHINNNNNTNNNNNNKKKIVFGKTD